MCTLYDSQYFYYVRFAWSEVKVYAIDLIVRHQYMEIGGPKIVSQMVYPNIKSEFGILS